VKIVTSIHETLMPGLHRHPTDDGRHRIRDAKPLLSDGWSNPNLKANECHCFCSIDDSSAAIVHESEMCGPPLVRDSGSPLPGVGESPKDSARALVHDLAKVHGDGEQEYQKEQIDAKN
jgi:hypothetical protein